MNKAHVRLHFLKIEVKDVIYRKLAAYKLLNVEIEILSRVLSNLRLGKLMPDLINEDQTCGVQGRHIQDSLMILRDTVDFINMDNKNGAIVCVD